MMSKPLPFDLKDQFDHSGDDAISFSSGSHQSQDGSMLDDSDNDKFDSAFGSGMGISSPGENDLLLGRGGETNGHSGNIKFRKLIDQYKPIYTSAPRREKPEIARQLVAQWKAQEPPGRFLEKRDSGDKGGGGDTSTKKLWYEISDEAAKKRATKSLGERQKVGRFNNKSKDGSSPPSSSLSSSTGGKQKSMAKFRSLEARAAAGINIVDATKRGSPGGGLSFPLDRAQVDGQSSSYLYQALRLPIEQLAQQTRLETITGWNLEGYQHDNSIHHQSISANNNNNSSSSGGGGGGLGCSSNDDTTNSDPTTTLPAQFQLAHLQDIIEPLDVEDHSLSSLNFNCGDDDNNIMGMNSMNLIHLPSSFSGSLPNTASCTPAATSSLTTTTTTTTDNIICNSSSNPGTLEYLRQAVPTAAELTECWEGVNQ